MNTRTYGECNGKSRANIGNPTRVSRNMKNADLSEVNGFGGKKSMLFYTTFLVTDLLLKLSVDKF